MVDQLCAQAEANSKIMEGGEKVSELVSILQAGGTPAIVAVAYLLWRLDRQMNELKVSIETLIDTMIRFVPGVRQKGD